MKQIREILQDRRRRQRGSVLSAVLIMTAFIAVISGALMTELSTNLLISRTLVNRIANQATENSAVEVSLSQLQAAPLNAPCPALAAATLNGVTATTSYLKCWPTVREATKAYAAGGSGSTFQVDGTHAQVNGLNDYVVGDAGGNVYDVPFGAFGPRWTLALGGQVTATPLVIPEPGTANEALDVVPLSGSSCDPAANCLDVRLDTAGSSAAPSPMCIQPASSGAVATQPAASPSTSGLVYYGDGTLLDATDVSTQEGTTCDFESSASLPNGQQVTGGVVAFLCSTGCGGTLDRVYAVVGDSSGSQLLRYGYYSGSLTFGTSLDLPWASATGFAASSTSLPAALAISFAGGGLALVQISSNGSMSLAAMASAAGGVADAPYWCHCPGGDVIAVGAQNGGLYTFNSALQPIAGYTGGSAIDTTPAADAAGDWYFGARDGLVHEVQLAGGTATQVDTFGPMGQVESAVQVAGCPSGICIYAGAATHIYLVPLDARRAIVSSCISSAPPTCSGANPRLWASVEVGAAGSPRTVHVEGWSYYSA